MTNKFNLPEYLEQHAQIVPHMQTAFLLRVAASELRKQQHVTANDFYIRVLPNGDFEVVYNED